VKKTRSPRGKRLRLLEPQEGDVLHMQEPTKAELGQLCRDLIDHRGKPLPPSLQNKLERLPLWAAWQIGRPWNRARIRYQRYRAVDDAIAHGLKLDDACAYAVKKLAHEPARGGIGVMKRDYLIEQGISGRPRRSRRRPRR
jgi:hypothetical protein